LSKSKTIWLILIGFAVLYGIYSGVSNHLRMDRLAHDLRYGNQSAKVAAATELMRRDRLYDKVQELKPAERIKAMDALESIPGALTVSQGLILLKDTEATVRARVTKVLIKVGKDQIKLLVPAMKDSDENVRNGAKDALVGIGPVVIPEVQKAAKVAELRAASFDVLVRLGEPSVPAVIPLLSQDDQDTRMSAAASLGKIRSMKATPALMEATRDIRAVREIAISALCDICDPRSTDLLVSVLSHTTDNGEVRARAARALSVIGGPKAIAALTNALGDFDLKVQSSVVGGLQRMGGPAIPAISAKLASGAKIVRESAARSLERTDSPAAIPVLMRLTKDPDPAIRASAARGLGVQSTGVRPEMLISLLSDREEIVGGAAVDSLAGLAGGAVPSLISVLKSPASDVVKYRAAEALSRIGSPAVPSLTALLGGDLGVARWAAYALGRTGDPSVKPLLQKLAKAGDKDLAAVAQRALNRM
jgi:HEAT repeat protein